MDDFCLTRLIKIFFSPIFRLVILAGDTSPIDVFSHIPVLCEENQIPYVYVPSKEVRFFFLLKQYQCY